MGETDRSIYTCVEDLAPSVHTKALEDTPLGRFGTPEEVAHAAYFLATNDFVTGTNLIVDGGITSS